MTFIVPTSLTLDRWMPPTGPKGNMPRVAIVIARLVVNGENRGVRPFVVALGDGKQMCKGVSSKYVPLNLSIGTSFPSPHINNPPPPLDFSLNAQVQSLSTTPSPISIMFVCHQRPYWAHWKCLQTSNKISYLLSGVSQLVLWLSHFSLSPASRSLHMWLVGIVFGRW